MNTPNQQTAQALEETEMDMQTAIRAVTEGRDLSPADMAATMHIVMSGEATPAQIGGFLVGLRMKGETVQEVAAAARVMRALATAVDVSDVDAVDVVGTGGDGVATFNISTTSAFVAAGAGAKVAKHGNRSVSSTSGAAEVLLQAGAELNLSPENVASCVRTAGFGFMFAPNHHAAMRHAIGPRREMGVRTIFNVLGPLTNPAGAKRQLIGVFSTEWVRPLAQVMRELGEQQYFPNHYLTELGLQYVVMAPLDKMINKYSLLRFLLILVERLLYH